MSADNEYRAEDWASLQELLYRDAWDDDLGRHRSPFVFRGHTNRDYHLRTPLRRFVGDSGRWDLEQALLRTFNKYAQHEIAEPASVWHLLAIAQHHGLPTRLLDWSRSPLVGAYFAVRKSGRPDVDGIVWAVDYRQVHAALPAPVKAIRGRDAGEVFDVDELARMAFDLGTGSEGPTTLGAAPTGGSLHLGAIDETLEAFTTGREDAFALFFEPPSIDDRIVNQSALFSVLSDPTMRFEHWLDRHPEACRKIIVPAERKAEFHDKLDQANVNQRLLFPDLDGLAGWVTEHLAPGETVERRRR